LSGKGSLADRVRYFFYCFYVIGLEVIFCNYLDKTIQRAGLSEAARVLFERDLAVPSASQPVQHFIRVP
jgi:hypothetical protein